MTVDCSAPPTKISPHIYGVAYDFMNARDGTAAKLGATARRWGGNWSSRYNWEHGHAWNAGNDWFFENLDYVGDERFSYATFVEENLAASFATAISVPTIGWVAKDTTSFSFPVGRFGRQAATDADKPDAGNGVGPGGKPLAPGSPTATSIPAPPEFIGRWVEAIRRADAARGARGVHMYILDNEPALWNTTHRDVRPEPLGTDELLERSIRYGGAIRKSDPDAIIAGPAEWGWTGYFYSAKDVVDGIRLRPDRRRHGDRPLVAHYLQSLREHEAKTGERILDVFDLHFYPQADGVWGPDGGTDRATSALRIRQTRGLWDPTYVDESWIKEPVMLIPRMKAWVAENYPGRALSIGEWSFGAESHMSGGLAVAEALGRFGQQGLDHAFYWLMPPDGSPAFWAFRAYRDFDGRGGRFLDLGLPTTAGEGTSLFASRDAEGTRMVLVALNLAPDTARPVRIELRGCGRAASVDAFGYDGKPEGFVHRPGSVQANGDTMSGILPPYSMQVYTLEWASRSDGGSTDGSSLDR